MRLFLKIRRWQENVGSYLRWWRKLGEQASLMEMWTVTGDGRESGENAGLWHLFKESHKRRRTLIREETNHQSINSTSNNDNLVHHS